MKTGRAAGRLPGRARLVLAGELVSSMGSGATVPYLVIYLHTVRGAGLAAVGVMLTVRAVLAIIGAAAGGTATDRVGARTVAVAGLGMAGLASVVAAAAGGPMIGFAAVAACTFACAALAPALDTLLARTVGTDLRPTLFGWRNAAVNLGGAAGAALASIAVATAGPTTGLIALYIVDGLSFAVFAVLIAAVVRGNATPVEAAVREDGRGGYGAVARDPAMRWTCAIVLLAVAGGFAVFHVGLPAFVAAAGLDVRALGWAFAANMVGVVVLQVPLQRLLPGRRRAGALGAALALMAAAWVLLLAAGASEAFVLVTAGLVFAAAETLFIPLVSTVVNDLATPGLRGRYNGAQTVAWTGGFLVGAAGTGAIVGAGAVGLLFPAGIAVLLIGALATVRLGRLLPGKMVHIPHAGGRTEQPEEQTQTGLLDRAERERDAGDHEAAERTVRSAIAGCRAAADPAGRIAAQTMLGGLWRITGRYRRAGLLLRLTLAAAEQRFGPDSPAVAAVCNEWAVLGKYTGGFDRAEALYRRALDILRAEHGERHDSVATLYHNLGGLAHARGEHAQGEPWARRAVELRTDVLGPDHPVVAAEHVAWAALLDGCGEHARAEGLLRRALAVFEAAPAPNHYDIAVVRNNLAAIHHRRGELDAAVDEYHLALAAKERLLGADHPDCATTLVNLAAAHEAGDRPAAAARLYARAAAILEPLVAPDHPTLCIARAGAEHTTEMMFERVGGGV
ncbi:MFS transporter [Dactylosporangium sp. CA-092794]|uniref:MFS transporter n=1 Tax=Dactylosporangium sp. CA-092794 TaxID=3239929 RepID=UPI003D9184E6